MSDITLDAAFPIHAFYQTSVVQVFGVACQQLEDVCTGHFSAGMVWPPWAARAATMGL